MLGGLENAKISRKKMNFENNITDLFAKRNSTGWGYQHLNLD